MSRSDIEQQLKAIVSGALNTPPLVANVVLGDHYLYDSETYKGLMTVSSEENAEGAAYGALWIIKRGAREDTRGPNGEIPTNTLLKRYTFLIEGIVLYDYSEGEGPYQQFQDMVDAVMDALSAKVTVNLTAFRTIQPRVEMTVEELDSNDVAFVARIELMADELVNYTAS